MRHQWLGIFIVALLAVAVAPSASAKKLLSDVTLDWSATTSVKATPIDVSALRGKTLQVAIFSDNRTDKKRIAENREDEDEGTILPVTTSTDIPAWVSNHLAAQLQQIGLSTVTNNGDYILNGSVEKFFVLETNSYNATVSLHLWLTNKNGETVWDTTLNANESRFGRSYKLENYAEVLSDAVVNLALGVAGSPDFRAALSNN